MKTLALLVFVSGVSATAREVTVRGRVLCLDAAGAHLSGACDPASSAVHHFGLETRDGKVYAFLREDTRAQIFTDPRVFRRELEVKGWARPGDESTLEITKVFSVIDGRLHDVYYFCAVCNITSHTPGLCWCCREEFELKEEPHTPVPPTPPEKD